MTRREQILAVLLKTFPAGSSLALEPNSFMFDYVTSNQEEAYTGCLIWKDGILHRIKVDGLFDPGKPYRFVAVMKQDGAGSPDLRLNDPDFSSRNNIGKQAQKLTFGRPLYVRYFALVNL